MGGKERGSPQASGVGPGWVGVLMSRWSPAGSSQARGIRYSGKARPLAWGYSLLSWHKWGTLCRWQHLCCCHKGEVVLTCCLGRQARGARRQGPVLAAWNGLQPAE